MKILFVCRGNIGRSQMAKEFYNALHGEKGSADACGTRVGEFEGQKIADIGSESILDDLRAMQEKGIDMSGNVRRQITKEIVDEADHVIVMAEKETWPEYLEGHPKVVVWDVENPKDVGFEKTKEIRDIIKNLVKNFHA